MAHLPTLPDPSERQSPHGHTGPFQASDSELSFTELTRLLGQHGAGSSSEDLALDLLLHEVAAQACSTTNAGGAAIALSRHGEFVCRATTGKHAPDLGSHLATTSGLSGACIQSGEIQRCDNTEVDARADAAASRRLGVRSVIVVPLLWRSDVFGILEVFSPRSHAFTDADIQTLLALSHRIMDTMKAPAQKEIAIAPATLFGIDTNPAPSRDLWTPVLTGLVVALALILGWVLGHKGWSRSAVSDKSQAAVAVSQKSAAPPANETSVPVASVPLATDNTTTAVAANPRTPAATPGGLVVYENGKLVFQVKPAPVSPHSEAVQVPPSAADSLVIERVEPQYPEEARLARIQGAVLLEVDVNEKGTVQELRALSGDPTLAMAAIEAVRQWRFRPYAPRGQALNFQTQVTVDFKLP